MIDVTEDPLDALAESFLVRFRRGERPPLEEYTDRHPELAPRIRELFPALVELEELGSVLGPIASNSRAATPKKLGEYRIIREIGRGGMGVVYEAVQETLGRQVALKVMQAGPHTPESLLERFRREARLAAKLHHGHVVPVYGVGTENGAMFYAMQFIDGQGLDSVLREARRIRQSSTVVEGGDSTGTDKPTSEISATLSRLSRNDFYRNIAHLGEQAAEALAHAHANGVLHRDIKPSNLLLDGRGHLWVTDFGLAKADEADELTREGDFIGTLRFMAPERFIGKADARSDVYSLGVTLYELLTFEPAFPGKDRSAITHAIQNGTHLPVRANDPSVPRDLETIIHKAMSADAGARYATADQLANDLRRFGAGEPVQARPPGVAERVSKWARRNPAWATLLMVSGLSLAVLAGIVTAYNYRLQAALASATQNLDEAHSQNERANVNLESLRQAVDQFVTLIESDPRLQTVDISATREKLYQSTIAHYERLVKQKGEGTEELFELGQARERLAFVLSRLRRFEEAITNHQMATEYFQKLVDRRPDLARYYRNLAGSLHNTGVAHHQIGQFTQADQCFEQALAATRRGLAIEPKHADLRWFLGKHLMQQGSYRTGPSDPEADKAAANEAYQVSKQLAEDYPKNPGYRATFVRTNRYLGQMAEKRRNLEEAESHYRNAADLSRALASEFPDNQEARLSLAESLTSFARLLRATRQAELALKISQESADAWESLSTQFPSRPMYIGQLIQGYSRLGVIHSQERRYSVSLRWLNRSIEVIEREKFERNKDSWIQSTIAHAYDERGKTLQELGRHSEAVTDFVMAAKTTPDESHRRNVEMARCWSLRQADRQVESEQSYRQLIHDMMATSEGNLADLGCRRDLARAAFQFGDLMHTTFRPDEAAFWFAYALTMREQIARDHPDNVSDQRLVFCMMADMARVFTDSHNDEMAMAWMDKALEFRDRLSPLAGHERYMRPWNKALLIARAKIYERRGQNDEADADRRAAAAIPGRAARD